MSGQCLTPNWTIQVSYNAILILQCPCHLTDPNEWCVCDIFNRHAFIYLDDILIFSRYGEQHIHQAWLVFQHLLKNSLYIKAEQCGWGLSHPCPFFSCCLSTAERNSDIGKRELFTVSYSGTIGWRLPIRLFVWTDLVCLLGSTPAQWTGSVYDSKKVACLQCTAS